MQNWLFSLALLLVLLAACGDSGAVREIGVITSNEPTEEAVLSVPTTVQVGVPFEVTVRTFGSGCTEADGTEHDITGNLAVLRPYDLTIIPGKDELCPLVTTRLEHTTQITFEEVGSAAVRVEGRDKGSSSTGGAEGDLITLEKTVRVE